MIKVTIGNNLSRQSVIIDENTTLRTALENANIDYTVGMTSLDGSTLGAGDLDKTFAQFGITEKCYLLNVVKADNAACIKIAGSACVIESAHSLDDIKTLEKYRPKTLVLYEGEAGKKEEVFRVGTTPKGTGTINVYGAAFGPQSSKDGKATITVMIPDGTENTKAWAEEHIGVAILNLNKVEKQFASALTEVKEEKKAVSDTITVM